MKKFLKRVFRKIFRGGYFDSNEYIEYLRKQGIRIGHNCRFYNCNKTSVDTQNPCMLSIGNNVRITEGVHILTHDYSFSVLCSVSGVVVGSVEKTTIGNNVFIGRNAIILKGVTIGDNVIIGAGSIVSKDCESNGVYAGNPARRICSIEEMYNKRRMKMKDNAKAIVQCYYERYGTAPREVALKEYQWLFAPRKIVPASLELWMKDSGCYEKCLDSFVSSEPEFNGYDEFLKWCGVPCQK